MKLLDGRELAGFIKERHAAQVRRLRGGGRVPKLAIVQAKDDPIIDIYVKLKRAYGEDIGISVDIHKPSMDEVSMLVSKLNDDETVHGIIVQLPLPIPDRTDEIVNLVKAIKDVDALGERPIYQPATPMAIMWLLAAYNLDLKDKKVLLIGRGKLVGLPLEKILKRSKIDVSVVTKGADELTKLAIRSDVIISAANEPGILTSEMIKLGAVIVDAGIAEEDGKTVGNVSEDVYARDDITITPKKGGVGPLTVCALFENLLLAAQYSIK